MGRRKVGYAVYRRSVVLDCSHKRESGIPTVSPLLSVPPPLNPFPSKVVANLLEFMV